VADTATTAPATPADPDRITPKAIAIVLVSTLGTATYSFTWYSVTVALPHMQGTFSATTDQIAWVMIAFIIGSAAMTASVGWLATRFGRKEVFLLAIAGVILFIVLDRTIGVFKYLAGRD